MKNQSLFATEHDMQVTIIEWAQLNRNTHPPLNLLYAVPNGARLRHAINRKGDRYSLAGQRLRAEGMRSGVPDLHLPDARGGYHGLWIELKRGKQGRISDSQKWWLGRLTKGGHCVRVCRSVDEAIVLLERYCALRETTRFHVEQLEGEE